MLPSNLHSLTLVATRKTDFRYPVSGFPYPVSLIPNPRSAIRTSAYAPSSIAGRTRWSDASAINSASEPGPGYFSR